MKKIIALGGGEIGSPGSPVETTKIDKEIINLTGKKNPRVLFIPTASSDSLGYAETFRKHFEDRLGCKVSVLRVVKEKMFHAEIERIVLSVDAIYVGGGNTLAMMRTWRACGLDTILRKAWDKGIVFSGLSAGSICWFTYGTSDSRRFNNPKADLIKVSGLGFIPATHSPHYDVEKDRRPGLKKIMKKTSGVAVAIDNCCAIECVGDTYRVISSKPHAKAYKVYWKQGKCHEEEIAQNKEFAPLRDLLTK